MVTLMFLVMSVASPAFGLVISKDVVIRPHAYPPRWVTMFAYLVPALLIDILRRPRFLVRGALIGFLWSMILVGLGYLYIDPNFVFPASGVAHAVLSGTL